MLVHHYQSLFSTVGYKAIPFWNNSAFRAADFGFLLKVKCFAGAGWAPIVASKAPLFKYGHSIGRRLRRFLLSLTNIDDKNHICSSLFPMFLPPPGAWPPPCQCHCKHILPNASEPFHHLQYSL